MRGIVISLLVLAMATGCASSQPPTTPARPKHAAPIAGAPDPAPPIVPPDPVVRVQLPKLALADVAYVVVGKAPPDNRSALLWPASHAGAIAALVDAFNAVQDGRRGESSSPWSEVVSIALKRPDSQGVSLTLAGDSRSMVLGWDGQPLLIESPALAQAVAALEPLLQPQPKPGSQIWAVDPAGSQPPELLLKHEQPIRPAAFSPDGRYWLLTRSVGQDKGDFATVPYLLDRTTGTLREGARVDMYGDPTWSGRGFFSNWPGHLDLSLKEDPMPVLRKALGVEPNVRNVIHISFTRDGKRFAALVGPQGREEPVDLVLGNTDGSGITVVPAAIRGTATQSGVTARVELSPDGEWLAIAGKGPAVIVRVADVSVRERWTQVDATSGWIPVTWSPDSRYVALAGTIYDRTGKLVLEVGQGAMLTWRPDSKALIVLKYAQVQVLGLDGTRTDLVVPDWSVPAGFLPDGRLIVFRTVYPDQR